MVDVAPDYTPPPEQRIEKVHCWIATQANGAEGIISADMPMEGFGMRHMPLLASKRSVAAQMEDLARRAQRGSMHLGAGRVVRIRLATFVLVEGDDPGPDR